MPEPHTGRLAAFIDLISTLRNFTLFAHGCQSKKPETTRISPPAAKNQGTGYPVP